MKLLRRVFIFLLCAVPTGAFAVTSKQYVAPETVILFADAAQTSTNKVLMTFTALGASAGRVSAQYDRTAASHAGWYKWRCWASLNGTPTVGQTIEYYIITSDGTRIDGEVGTADAALTVEKRRNLTLMGVIAVDQTTTNITMTTSGFVYVPDRYISIGTWNATSLAFESSTTKHGCNLIPMPPELQ